MDNSKNPSNVKSKTKRKHKKPKGMCSIICLILGTPTFIYATLATSVIFFVISGVQFWASDYMLLALNMPESIVFPAFSIISLTAPTLG